MQNIGQTLHQADLKKKKLIKFTRKRKNIKFYYLSFLSTKNKAIINTTVHTNTDIVFKVVVFAPHTSKNRAPIIIPMA